MQLSKLGEFLEFDMLSLLREQGVVFQQNNNKIKNNGIIHYEYPEKLIEQYEFRINEKEEFISLLKEKIARLENTNKSS